MNNYSEKKQKAEQLRRSGDFDGAIQIFRELWNENKDPIVGAGLLYCIRKLKLFEEAIPLADELINNYSNIDWVRNEFIWTYISGILQKFDINEPLDKLLQIAQKIMDYNPEDMAKKMIVFKVMEVAKASANWEIVNEWAEKIDPEMLSTTPMSIESRKEGWSDRARWYNYRLNAFYNISEFSKLIDLVDEISNEFPKQKPFFLRLKAKACMELGELSKAEEIFQELCRGPKSEWWLLQDYAALLRTLNRKEESLKFMYQAASKNPKLETSVTLFMDIGELCRELGKNEEARAHFNLCQLVRSRNNWSIPESLKSNIEELNEIIGNKDIPESIKEALDLCKNYWENLLGNKFYPPKKSVDRQKITKDLWGTIALGDINRPYGFINTDKKESFFCSKSDLPPNIKEGDTVVFDAVPSFDRKKGKESLRAVNIRINQN